MKIKNYSSDKEWVYYDNGQIAHRHILPKSDIAYKLLDCPQAYYLVTKGCCSKCGKKVNI